MSHYPVAVIHRTDQSVDDLLERYDESLDVEFDPEEEYWYNPDAKWDWYEVGGRWSGLLKTKSGEHVNEALIKDVDFSPSDDREYYLHWWDVVINGADLDDGEDEDDFLTIFNNQYYVDRYIDADTYADEMVKFSTYAIVTPDGEWHAPGEVGWFGISLAEHEAERKWFENYDDFIKTANPYHMITIVDCHI